MHKKIVQGGFTAAASLCLFAAPALAHAGGLERIQFVVVDAKTRLPILDAQVTIEDQDGRRPSRTITAGPSSLTFNTRHWILEPGISVDKPMIVTIPVGTSVALAGQAQPANAQQPPVAEVHIRVTATRLPTTKSGSTAGGSTISEGEIKNKAGVGGDVTKALEGKNGVAADSAGQLHVRGEHAEISYVVDGVQVPDMLSGRQGSVVVASTIRSLEFITGGFAPEFGQQTAAILNIETQPGAKHSHSELSLEGGSFDTTNADFTTTGPIGRNASYVLDFSATRTRLATEAQQPDNQTAHNAGSDLSEFGKFRLDPSKRDTLSLTLSRSPSTMQIGNRTGLPSYFANAGQGYGFQGYRDQDGSRPASTVINPNGLGADNMPLLSQQAEGMDITQREVSEFGTLAWRRILSTHENSLFAVTLLHSGQDVVNNNPAVNLLNLPIDNSIEYNPTAIRNVHHVQMTGNVTSDRNTHHFKAGFLLDDQNGNETYNIRPASQLALDELAALSPSLAPAGTIATNAQGAPITDVNGNPVYNAGSNTSPTLNVHRAGFYRAGYLQDTWHESRKFVINYGMRADWYKQGQNLGQPVVDVKTLSPRLNFSYAPDPKTSFRWSYDKLFNTPPLAQGAVVGQPIQPEILDQYDVAVSRNVSAANGIQQNLHLAYYIKQMKNQVDTGLLIPGSEIGIYSAVNFQIGAVHGIEFGYDITPPKGKNFGWDASFNYTYSVAAPNGLDNTGAPAPDFNDHDQRNTIGVDGGYTWKSGVFANLTLDYGSGLASSAIPPSTLRIPRTEINLRAGTGNRLFHGHGGIGLSIDNLLDARTVINFESGFSGTRFMEARRVLFNANLTF